MGGIKGRLRGNPARSSNSRAEADGGGTGFAVICLPIKMRNRSTCLTWPPMGCREQIANHIFCITATIRECIKTIVSVNKSIEHGIWGSEGGMGLNGMELGLGKRWERKGMGKAWDG